jgi:hypothetical protein
MAPNPDGRQPKFAVEPPEPVRREIENHNTSLNEIIEQAKLSLLQNGGDEAASARLFIERGYSDDYAEWLVSEAKAREKVLAEEG